MTTAIPWVEKYRPQEFDEIVLESANKKILENILKTGYFPNLLLHGPPGTGKTTTIVNLINTFQQRYYGRKMPSLVMQLNASDDRGIDTIRDQISNFVTSSGLFHKGVKFVILDEIDYMTKNAQYAFRYLLNVPNVRFCLMCNYISKIEEGLQNNFLKLRFNQLPAEDTQHFLQNIATKENLPLNAATIKSIQVYYKSDIRSMINFLQTNQDFITTAAPTAKPRIHKKNMYVVQNIPMLIQVIDNSIWGTFITKIKTAYNPIDNLNPFIEFVYSISLQYNIDMKTIVKQLLQYIIVNELIDDTKVVEFLNATETLLHTENLNMDIYLKYALTFIITALN